MYLLLRQVIETAPFSTEFAFEIGQNQRFEVKIMYFLAASGFCLAALVGSVIYETKRMKKEEENIKQMLARLAREF